MLSIFAYKKGINMTEQHLIYKLTGFRELAHETEIVEFKEAKNDYHFDKIGKYFSALSNEANLKGSADAWLIFGIKDSNRKIVGSNYRKTHRAALDSLKGEIAQKTTNRITFIEIYDLSLPEGRVIMFQIPAAPKGLPIAWEGHYYGRDGEELSPLNLEEIERIRKQVTQTDWSALICPNATVKDLDPLAIKRAREEYLIKFPSREKDLKLWDTITFLNKARVTIGGKITNTALLLLGNEDAQHLLSPSFGKVTWILRDENNVERDYEHFYIPFLLTSDKILNKIRNLNYRYLPDNTLFPNEVTQYDPYVIREALHNCIAHQQYDLQSRINLIEFPEHLVFQNAGSFLPKTVEHVIEHDAPQHYYRNKFLCEAMANLNMIDTIGSGIKKMFISQRNRFFPLPTYNLSMPQEVKVTVFGKIIDRNYTQLLIDNESLDLKTVMLLDKVQKSDTISDTEAKILRENGLIEGRKPNYFVNAQVAEVTRKKASYIKNKAFDDEHYRKMILAFIKQYGVATRQDINDLLLDKLSDVLNRKQKISKIGNLLTTLKVAGLITNSGTFKKPEWILLNQ